MRLLLHCCCGPCAVACVESLSTESLTPDLFWYNPNIHPHTEYQSRLDALVSFAAAKGLSLEQAGEYGLRLFLAETGGMNAGAETPTRCETCYRLRLEKTAARAAELSYAAFSTTLLISPYQRHDAIRRIGEEAAARHGVEFLYRDFRPLFREGQTKARALGLYAQKYCGCIFSEEERYSPKKTPPPTYPTPHRPLGLLKQARHNCNSDSCLGSCHGESVNGRGLNAALSLGIPTPLSLKRLSLITGEESIKKLHQTSVIVFGLGGVGSWCAEALVRSGIGKIGIVDYDTVDESNINRQAQATSRTIGLGKAEALKQRLLEINPGCEVAAWKEVFSRENAPLFGIEKADFVIDAIDSLENKLDLVEICKTVSLNGGRLKFFSSMGMAWKMDPSRIKTGGIWKTKDCPLARLVRQGLRRRGFTGDFTVVYSDEPKIAANDAGSPPDGNESRAYGSAVTVTAAAGMLLASLVLRSVTGSI